MRYAPLLVFVCWAAPVTAQSQSAALADDTLVAMLDRLARLERRIQVLETENAEMRAGMTRAASGSDIPETPVEPIGGEWETITPGQESHHTSDVYPNLRLSGFMDVEYAVVDADADAGGGFNLGQFALQLASPLSPKINFFGEISVTPRPTAFAVELERSFVRYDYNDAFKVSVGRFHTPVNYWNTAFHHGTWLQTTVTRPEMTRFGGTLVPVHFVGAQAEGFVTMSRFGVGYNVGVGNGRGATTSRAGDAGDINRHRAWLVALHARPRALPGVQVGVAHYRDRVSVAADHFNEALSSVHLAWNREPFEALAELTSVEHRRRDTGTTFDSRAFYAQVAYRVPWQDKRWKPYFRYERLRADASDPLVDLGDGHVNTSGIRYDFGELVALKGEFRRTVRTPARAVNGFFFQTSLAF